MSRPFVAHWAPIVAEHWGHWRNAGFRRLSFRFCGCIPAGAGGGGGGSDGGLRGGLRGGRRLRVMRRLRDRSGLGRAARRAVGEAR